MTRKSIEGGTSGIVIAISPDFLLSGWTDDENH